MENHPETGFSQKIFSEMKTEFSGFFKRHPLLSIFIALAVFLLISSKIYNYFSSSENVKSKTEYSANKNSEESSSSNVNKYRAKGEQLKKEYENIFSSMNPGDGHDYLISKGFKVMEDKELGPGGRNYFKNIDGYVVTINTKVVIEKQRQGFYVVIGCPDGTIIQ